MLGRKTVLSTRDSANVEIALFAYGHDKTDQRTNETTLTHTDRFEYDAKRQLVSAQRYDLSGNADATWSYRYAYDPRGNWTTVTDPDGVHRYTANTLNQYKTETNASERALRYDLDGNLLVNGETAFAFGDDDHLIVASNDVRSVFRSTTTASDVVWRSAPTRHAMPVSLFIDGALVLLKHSNTPSQVYRVSRGLEWPSLEPWPARRHWRSSCNQYDLEGVSELVPSARGDVGFERDSSASRARDSSLLG